MKEIFYLLSIAYVVITILPLIKHDGWWIRIFEFPRLQITFIGATILIFAFVIFDNNLYFYFSGIAVSICLVYQVIKVAPYTILYPKQLLKDHIDTNNESIKVMIANVFMNNRNYDGLVDLIKKYTPDILLVIEVDYTWYENLREKLNYDYIVAKPLDNTYGMALYSNCELHNECIEFLIEDDVPSIHTIVRHPSGREIFLHCLHPKPPAPQESTQTTERDAELLIVGKRVKEHGNATIVVGDLNDVAWSYTTTLFQKISGLLDPRIGRGMFSTFHVKTPFFRFPLDHAFASKHFKLKSLKRLSSFGSDHFPIFIEFVIDSLAPLQHVEPTANQSDKQEAEDKIDNAIS